MKPGASYKTKMGKQILIHGLGQGPESWSAVLSALLPAEERCCLNLPELLDGQCSYENLYGTIKKAARELAGLIQGAELRTVENAGHELNTDAPEELARLMNEFWNGKR